MIYQFPFETALYTTLFDLLLILFTFGATRIPKTTYKRTSFVIIFLFFGCWSLIKLIGSSPGAAASTPNDLTFQSDSNIGTFYLARATKGEYLVFWKETIFDNVGTLTIEMEGTYPDQLIVLKKINGQFKELQPYLAVIGNTYEPITINVSDSEFKPLTDTGNKVIEKAWKRDFMNYTSNSISIIFLICFFWLTLRKNL